jgi:hypothetical protein
MATKREQRLAKAIEALSARDMYRLVQIIGKDYAGSNKREMEYRFLQYAGNNIAAIAIQQAGEGDSTQEGGAP